MDKYCTNMSNIKWILYKYGRISDKYCTNITLHSWSSVASTNIGHKSSPDSHSFNPTQIPNEYICDMFCFALAYLGWFDARTPCNILISPCLEGITCDGPHLSERFTTAPCNLCNLVLKFDTHTVQRGQQHKGGSFITGNKNLLNGPTPHLLGGCYSPPALHIITLDVRCSQE